MESWCLSPAWWLLDSLLDAARKWLLGHGLPDAQFIMGVVR
ncbi:MAG: hypothetical protein Q8J61_00485 [Sulfuricella sp.]|nr:hypothetical protein [Sulfuricella sp.]